MSDETAALTHEPPKPRIRRGLFMFALLPPDPLTREIRALQQLMATEYHSSEALRRPVHLTLIPPFETAIATEERLIEFTAAFARSRTTFDLHLDGFGQFRERVIFLKPIENEALADLHDSLVAAFGARFPDIRSRSSHDSFHPHFTVGYRDLTHPMFRRAWARLGGEAFMRTFVVDHITLLRHDVEWVEIARGAFVD